MPFLTGCVVAALDLPSLPNLPGGWSGAFEPEERTEYTGADTVGAVNASELVGTWTVETINASSIEKEFKMQFVLNEDKSFSSFMKIEMVEPIGKFHYDIQGTWSVDGDYVNILPATMQETTGNSWVTSEKEVLDEAEMIGNVYETSPNYLVIYDEEDEVAMSFTRVE